MGETLAKCLTCGTQVPVKVTPVPYLFTCEKCGPLPFPDPKHGGVCRALGGHIATVVYDTPRFGPLCAEHFELTVRIGYFGSKK